MGGECKPEFVELVEDQHSGCLFTRIVEDCLGLATNSHEQRTTSRYRKPERGWTKFLCGDVLNARHKYNSVHQLSNVTKSLRLDKAAHRSTEDMDSIDEFKSIASMQASVPWHSLV